MVTFNGYERPTGRVGIRNHIMIISNCSCANGIVNNIAAQVPDAVPMLHTYGCSIPGEYDRWRRVLTGVCTNPNIYGVILVGVGCETDDAKEMGARIHEISKMPVFAQIVQDDGGGDEVVRKCVEKARELLGQAAECKRVPVPVSKLVLGTECGGSDALSGITANPTIGYVSDWLVANGGTSLLSEAAEMIGTEDILSARAINPDVGAKIRAMIEREELEVRKYLGPDASRIIARGNMKGGLTTIQEKALGCIRKGGTSTIMDVLDYAEPIGERKGLVIMHGPGYDPVSLTGLFATGAQVFLFSTGRGNPLGYPVAPCIKICSNSSTYYRVGGKNGDMDINAGAVISEGMTLEELGEYSIEYLLKVCNGQLSVPEKKNYGGIMCAYSASTPL
jgi:altronate dehydratase large subunit